MVNYVVGKGYEPELVWQAIHTIYKNLFLRLDDYNRTN